MNQCLEQLINRPLLVKKTNNIFWDEVEFLRIERVESYYIEKHKKYTWLKQWKKDIFIYGNPFPCYSFS